MNIEMIENPIGMKLVKIPAGQFFMGSPVDEIDRDPDEGPRHRVIFTAPLLIGVYPVTQEQYERVMGRNYSKFQSPDHPAEMVSRPDAVEFCKKLSEIAGETYSLPNEAQWEYACRAGSDGAYCFGSTARELGEYAWYAGNSDNRTHPVGRKRPNAWGLYDMHGNVWEWCGDLWYSQGYPGTEDRTDPVGTMGYTHVLRGGCYYSDPQAVRSAKRFGYNETNRFPSVGFRVVCPARK